MAACGRSDDDYDLLMKVLLIGDNNVGKTSCLRRFCRNEFDANQLTTVGIDFNTQQMGVGDGDLVKCQFWDTPGQERFRTIMKPYYRKTMGALLVYDVTQLSTFESIPHWLKDLRENSCDDVVVMLVGNKTDLKEQREVSVQQGQEIAEREGLLFIETSALDGSNVEEAFGRVAKEIHTIVRNGGFQSHQEQQPAQQSRCCIS